MLDCGRHYIPPADVKRMIDLAALHKLNTFHWHLIKVTGLAHRDQEVSEAH